MPDDKVLSSLPPAMADAAPRPAAPSASDEMIDKWWSDSVAALQSSDWSAKVDAKEDLKKRVAGILKK